MTLAWNRWAKEVANRLKGHTRHATEIIVWAWL